MLHFSKSKYCEFKQCPKACWLTKYKPELREVDAAVEARFTKGNEVGDLAMGLFGDYVEVTSYKPDGSLDLNKMTELTKQAMQEGREVICEASFLDGGLYCAVDILRKTDKGYAMYEVKSSTHPEKRVYLLDVCYQKYVLEKCGVLVDGVYLVTLDRDYVFDGTLDIQKLFKITDLSTLVEQEIGMVEGDLKRAEETLALPDEPSIPISASCRDPYACSFWKHCTQDLPTPSVFDLYRIEFNEALELYHKGIRSFEDVSKSGTKLSKHAKRQIEFELEKKEPDINKEGIQEFLDTLTYPLYFLDFESVQLAVPQYLGTRTYQQVVVQYSLHILEKPDGELKHKEYLARPESNSCRELAQRLVEDIPANACVLVYNKGFEGPRIRELAAAFPDFSQHLLAIAENLKDLLVPFRKGYYYNRRMGGSFSIKSVLPALFPDDPSLDYHKLDGVHNGSEAMELFPRLKDMPQEERKIAERNLLKYCELDTFAMVKVLWELLRVAS